MNSNDFAAFITILNFFIIEFMLHYINKVCRVIKPSILIKIDKFELVSSEVILNGF